jgi:cytochrome c oxidase subunit 3
MMHAAFAPGVPGGTPMPGDLPQRSASVGVALWVFIGVAATLFALFLTAYVMRMSGSDWARIGMPWQLWLSSGLLAASSLSLEASSRTANKEKSPVMRRWLLVAGVLAIAFLTVQGWSWQALIQLKVTSTGNPAASFFYLLTAMHGLHVVGGLLCWLWVLSVFHKSGDTAESAWRLRLLARYWHFLLLLWGVLFAALAWLTPELVAYICGTR